MDDYLHTNLSPHIPNSNMSRLNAHRDNILPSISETPSRLIKGNSKQDSRTVDTHNTYQLS